MADKKFTKAEVNYGPGMRKAHCGICAHYRPNDTCEIVEGDIDPAAWCRKFSLDHAKALYERRQKARQHPKAA